MSEISWHIRSVVRADLGSLLEIETEQFPEPWSRKMLLEEISNTDNRRYSVAVERNDVLGYLGVMFVLDEMHVNTIGTRAVHEGKGVATSLLAEVWAPAKERGATKATLEVAASNHRAQALYRRFGFAPVGLRKNYYAKSGEDALVLWAELGATPWGER